MTEPPRLFAPPARFTTAPAGEQVPFAALPSHAHEVSMGFEPAPSLLELFECADNPDDPFELRDLYLGRVEAHMGAIGTRGDLAVRWKAATKKRTVDVAEVLHSRATPRFVKETFNSFFRDDLYGSLRSDDQLILSTGAVDEEAWGLPTTIKDCIAFALDRDWYGYSDSRGREPAREAIAAYESARLHGAAYTLDNVALTMGGTFALSCLADFILTGHSSSAPSLCAIPNYPPLVESIARRGPVQLVPTPVVNGRTSIDALIDQLRPDTPLVLLQTVTNPTGTLVDEQELSRLIRAAGPQTMILLDECHEWLGPPQRLSPTRAAGNVVRISSLSKNWSAPGMKVGWILAGSAFIDAYYEYASSSFGGPPSFFYTAIEVLARMERWRDAGIDELGPEQLSEFEDSYGLTRENLQMSYGRYVRERAQREHDLVQLRNLATARLDLPSTTVAAARYSINTAVRLHDFDDSYVAFRELLEQENVAVFPGILTFCLDEAVVRVTTSRRLSQLGPSLDRIESFLARRRAQQTCDQGLAKGSTPHRSASPAASGPANT
ncbi:pyridoxal phosphate-dependent aminotransferase [Dactylosporangium sp. NPDC051541]|uniref:pyridoxal phosphate-dependent aminotransferase n=1 Tax=Dactylosporangium sp. NPDC051541 TaxID=3363977 RepID=UPI0037A005FD